MTVEAAGGVAGTNLGSVDIRPGKAIPRVESGGFRISLDPEPGVEDASKQKTLRIQPTGEASEAQLALYGEISSTKTVLSGAFGASEEINKFNDYITRLAWIAQGGLETPAFPKVAAAALANFKSEVLAVEGARIKNRYMSRLGIWTAGFTLLGLGIFLLLRGQVPLQFAEWRAPFEKLALLWVGSMVGCWLSFGIRNPQLTFASLAAPDSELLIPPLRALFTGLLTLTLGLAFATGLVTVAVGAFSTSALDAAVELTGPNVALLLLVGLFCGVSEQALSTTIGKQAAKILPVDLK